MVIQRKESGNDVAVIGKERSQRLLQLSISKVISIKIKVIAIRITRR